jgi:hypothetical protein
MEGQCLPNTVTMNPYTAISHVSTALTGGMANLDEPIGIDIISTETPTLRDFCGEGLKKKLQIRWCPGNCLNKGVPLNGTNLRGLLKAASLRTGTEKCWFGHKKAQKNTPKTPFCWFLRIFVPLCGK